MIDFASLTSAQQEMLGMFFTMGPVWDGYLPSKMARDDLVDLGLAFRHEGFQALTRAGLAMAVAAPVSHRRDQRWYRKQQALSADGEPL